MNKRQQNILILILGAIAALGPFSIDMYLPAFSAIAEDLQTDVSQVSWTLASYFIGISVGQLIYGPIIDRFGRKRPLLIGLMIYLLAAIGCALSPDIYWLVVLRLFLALGGCVGMVASRAIVRDRFPLNETARVFSSLILVMGVAPILAPTIGGYVVAHGSWRYIFVFLALISLALILIIFFALGESRKPDPTTSLKLKSVSRGYLQVLQNKDFLLFGLAGSISMAGMFAYIAGSPVVFMDVYGLSEKAYGWIFGLNAFGFIMGSQLNRLLLKRRSSLKLTYFTSGLLLLTGALLVAAHFSSYLPVTLLVILLFSYMFFMGFINPNTTALALQPFTERVGIASALVGSFRMISGAIASAFISLLYKSDQSAWPMISIMFVCCVLVYLFLQSRKRSDKKVLTNRAQGINQISR